MNSSEKGTKYGRLMAERKDLPADEPMFVLRGKDLLAPSAVESYANLLRAAAYATAVQTQEITGVDSREATRLAADNLRNMAREVSNVAAEMIAWQASNPSRVKLPD